MEENQEKALNLLAEYHDIFALEDGEMECTKAAKHKIKVTDLKPFKERPRNIVMLFQCGSSPFKFKSFSNKFRIWNNSSSCFMCSTSKIY